MVNIFQGEIFFRGEYFSVVNLFQGLPRPDPTRGKEGRPAHPWWWLAHTLGKELYLKLSLKFSLIGTFLLSSSPPLPMHPSIIDFSVIIISIGCIFKGQNTAEYPGADPGRKISKHLS